MMNKIIFLLFTLISVSSCNQKSIEKPLELLDKADFNTTIKGKQVSLYNLSNNKGTVVQITNFGGKVASLWIADKDGKYEDVVLGYPSIDGYLTAKEKYFGALIGRYGNRIGGGKFSLDSIEYNVATNNAENHLHGGNIGFDAVVWDATQVSNQQLELTYLSKNMEEGYPGNLQVKVLYQLTDANELKIEYWATTDASTIVNLTHHSFFNFHGAGNGSINDHILQVNADNYTPVDSGLIPTGVIESVAGTPFDFMQPITIGSRLHETNEQLKYGSGYDHNFVLNGIDTTYRFAAKVTEPISGRQMEVYTNEPGLQFYGGNFLDGTIVGKNNKNYIRRSAFCLETQHFPDSPNKLNFPTTRLDPGEDYYSICVYKFSTVGK